MFSANQDFRFWSFSWRRSSLYTDLYNPLIIILTFWKLKVELSNFKPHVNTTSLQYITNSEITITQNSCSTINFPLSTPSNTPQVPLPPTTQVPSCLATALASRIYGLCQSSVGGLWFIWHISSGGIFCSRLLSEFR